MHLRNTSVGVRIASSLEVYLSGKSLLFLPTSLPQRLSSLPKAVTCVVIIFIIDPIHIQNDVSILACFSSFSMCATCIALSVIFNVLFSYESQNLQAHSETAQLPRIVSCYLRTVYNTERTNPVF